MGSLVIRVTYEFPFQRNGGIMGKLLKDLHFSELRQQLEARCLSTKGKKVILRERLELWLYRKGHDPKIFLFKDSLEKMALDVKEIRDHLLNVEAAFNESMKTFQETLVIQLGNITAKLEDLERVMKVNTKCNAGAKHTEVNPAGNMGDKSDILIAQDKKQDNFNMLKYNKVNDKLDKKQEPLKQDSIGHPNFSSILVDEASSISVVAPENDKPSSDREQKLSRSSFFINLRDDSKDDEASSQQNKIRKIVAVPSKTSHNAHVQIKRTRGESPPRSHSDAFLSHNKMAEDKEHNLTETFDADLMQGQHASSDISSSGFISELSWDETGVEKHTFLKRSYDPPVYGLNPLRYCEGVTITTQELLKNVAHRLEEWEGFIR